MSNAAIDDGVPQHSPDDGHSSKKVSDYVYIRVQWAYFDVMTSIF